MINWSSSEKIKTPLDIQIENNSRVAKEYLAETDWYVIRFFEEGTAIPEEIKEARAAARASIIPAA